MSRYNGRPMPIPVTADLPPPLWEDEFEDMVEDELRVHFSNPHLARLGRKGQRQGGIDGSDPTQPRGQSVVWQTTLAKEVKSKILLDLAEVDRDPLGQPKLFVVALGKKRDKPLQDYYQALSSDRTAAGKCPVIPKFWEDIRGALCKDESLLKKYFPSWYPADSGDSGAITRTAPTDAQCLEGHREAVRRARIVWFLSRDDPGWVGIMNEMLEWFEINQVFLTETAAAAFMAIERWKSITAMTDGEAGANLFKAADEGYSTLRKELLRFRKSWPPPEERTA